MVEAEHPQYADPGRARSPTESLPSSSTSAWAPSSNRSELPQPASLDVPSDVLGVGRSRILRRLRAGAPGRAAELEAWLRSQTGNWHSIGLRATVLLRAHRAGKVGEPGELAELLAREVERYRVEAPSSWETVLVALDRVRAQVEAIRRDQARDVAPGSTRGSGRMG